MRRRVLITTILTLASLGLAAPAYACGGLLSPNGSVNLLKTTTLAAYHQGVEHYITSFRFVGGGGAKFGSIVPLPGVPTDVVRGGDWTLQRLIREVRPPAPQLLSANAAFGGVAERSATVLLEKQIEALDITVLEGGGAEVARWAEKNGFILSPDAPEVLDFYADRSPIFLAARFDSKRAQAQGLNEGDGTPIHISIPTPQPWVPLRILGLGKQPTELVEADIFLLTDQPPSMLPAPAGFRAGDGRPGAAGMALERSEKANDLLISDLRADKGMEWMPKDMWLSYMPLSALANDLKYDLALDATGAGQPSYVAAGLKAALRDLGSAAATAPWGVVLGVALALVAALVLGSRRPETQP